MRTIRYEIGPRDGGKKVEQFLREDQGFSGRVIIALKKLPQGLLLNGEHTRTVDLLSPGDVLEVNLPQETKRMPLCDIPVPVLYEDEDVLVYNKPAGMPCHQSGGHIFGTLSSVYAARCAQTGEITTFRAVNRLDKDTTGAVVVAKNQIAGGKLWKAVQKRYIALVEGCPAQPRGLIDLPIDREVPLEMKRIVTPQGQEARTEYQVLAQGRDCALVGFFLHTGRTHQIRVHMSWLGCPLVGDDLYGRGAVPEMGRQALHCARVFFPHVLTGQEVAVSAPLPEDMALLLADRGILWREELADFAPGAEGGELPLILSPQKPFSPEK